MGKQALPSSGSADGFVNETIPDLADAVWSLYGAGMSRRGISELLNVHEAQIRDLLGQESAHSHRPGISSTTLSGGTNREFMNISRN